MKTRVLAILLSAPALLAGRGAAAQQEATVEAIAPILMAEDARRWDEGLFRRGLEHSDPLVRRKAALAVGRLRDRRGTPLLVTHLNDPDSTVQAEIMFALGVLQDTVAVAPIIARFTEQPGLWREAAQEGVTALAKLNDPRVGAFFSGIIRRTQPLTVDSVPLVVVQVARELWRLGSRGPVADLVPFLRDTLPELRQAALYSIARVRPPAAASDLLLAMRDELPLLRSWAARALSRAYADSADLAGDAVIAALKRLLADEDDGVRISALRSLATFRLPELSGAVAPLLGDPDINTRVQAAATLGQTGGPAAAASLVSIIGSREPWAVRREAMLSLARVDSTAFLSMVTTWSASTEWRDRAVASEGFAAMGAPAHPAMRQLLENERDGRVIAQVLQAWNGNGPLDPALLQSGRKYLNHGDAAVRSVAAGIVGRAQDPADIGTLTTAFRTAVRDSFPDAALAILAALDTIAGKDPATAQRVERDFLDMVPRPQSYLIRQWAEASWPAAAERWGETFPVETGRTLEDYRELARRFVVGTDPSRYPHVFIETEQRTVIELELYGPDAPMTVANFLLLVDRHFFDGNSWHRVVPNFVVQDGDRRGDGYGGAPGIIRDEINRRKYGAQVLGMALSGPDTGSSQWFITHSPQPHLDGIYTVFGRVVSGGGALRRVSQGDRINTIRR
jgi:cyclophilin family peptidyl-prolyl cis-trans isomerase/HEAT repeat protein